MKVVLLWKSVHELCVTYVFTSWKIPGSGIAWPSFEKHMAPYYFTILLAHQCYERSTPLISHGGYWHYIAISTLVILVGVQL